MERLMRLLECPPDAREGQEGALSDETMRRLLRRLPPLEGERVILRLPRMADAGDLFAYASDEELSRHVLWETHRSPADSRDVLRGIIRRNRRGLPVTLAVTLRGDGRMIGTIGFQWIDAESRSCEIGYSVARRLWNRGIATDALKAMLPLCFDMLELNRVQARYDLDNPASGRVMEKAGFRYEGVARQSLMLKGRLADMACCAIVREDWRRANEEKQSAENAGAQAALGAAESAREQ